MLFGEIIEPSTRALLYEEDDILTQERIEWQQHSKIPEKIDAFLITETSFMNRIILSCLLHNLKPVAVTNKEIISIYLFSDNKYIAVCKPTADTSIGEVIENLLPWIKVAQACYSIMTQPTACYQNRNVLDRPGCILRMLASDSCMEQLHPTLEIPNLVTGIGAGCLSYCMFAAKHGSLFIGYIDHAPIDSINSKPFIELLKHLGFDSHGIIYKQTDALPENNLYT